VTRLQEVADGVPPQFSENRNSFGRAAYGGHIRGRDESEWEAPPPQPQRDTRSVLNGVDKRCIACRPVISRTKPTKTAARQAAFSFSFGGCECGYGETPRWRASTGISSCYSRMGGDLSCHSYAFAAKRSVWPVGRSE
jgi:hypothetical protein